jgi:hypothetical protein
MVGLNISFSARKPKVPFKKTIKPPAYSTTPLKVSTNIETLDAYNRLMTNQPLNSPVRISEDIKKFAAVDNFRADLYKALKSFKINDK